MTCVNQSTLLRSPWHSRLLFACIAAIHSQITIARYTPLLRCSRSQGRCQSKNLPQGNIREQKTLANLSGRGIVRHQTWEHNDPQRSLLKHDIATRTTLSHQLVAIVARAPPLCASCRAGTPGHSPGLRRSQTSATFTLAHGEPQWCAVARYALRQTLLLDWRQCG